MITSDLVTSGATFQVDWPVRGMSSPLSAGLCLMKSGVSPCAICHVMSPLSRLIAVSVPYGGLTSGSPWTVVA